MNLGCQLSSCDTLLKTEFGDEISEMLTLLPSMEMTREKQREACCQKRNTVVSDDHEMQEEYIRSWPQVIPKDIVYGCLNAYYNGKQWAMPPICSVCLRQQHAVEMHDIVLKSNEEIPEYLSIL